jgi:serine/threonine protein kinase
MENAKFVEEAGYRLTSDEIDRGSSSEVYRCVRQKDGVPVRVKVLSLSFPMPRHLSNFQHEYNIVESLKTVPGVVAIYDRISRHNFEALVLEDFGGEDLFKCLERDGPFAAHLEQFIDIAISLAISLGQIHSHSIVHKDIKVPSKATTIYSFYFSNLFIYCVDLRLLLSFACLHALHLSPWLSDGG